MRIEQALIKHLLANPGVTTLVKDRVHLKKYPQRGELPAIVIHKVSGPREHSHDGPSALAHPRYQFDIYAKDAQAANDLAEKVRLALDGYKGTMGGVDGVRVDGVFLEDERDDYDDGAEVQACSLDFTVWHGE